MRGGSSSRSPRSTSRPERPTTSPWSSSGPPPADPPPEKRPRAEGRPFRLRPDPLPPPASPQGECEARGAHGSRHPDVLLFRQHASHLRLHGGAHLGEAHLGLAAALLQPALDFAPGLLQLLSHGRFLPPPPSGGSSPVTTTDGSTSNVCGLA